MKQKEIKTLIRVLAEEELSDQDRRLVEAAKEMTYRSYAPYSRFNVGAAVLMDNGEIITGANQENAAYPSGTCAERTACFYASSQFPGMRMRKLAVAARNVGQGGADAPFQKHPVSPCGACRQAIVEYEAAYGDIEVLLYGADGIYVLPSVRSLLPLSFTEF